MGKKKKKKMSLPSFCPVVSLLLLLFPAPFKLLCKKCSLVGVRVCVCFQGREKSPDRAVLLCTRLADPPTPKPAHAPCACF